MSMKAARIAAIVLTIVSVVLAFRLELSKDLTALFPRTKEASTLARVTHALGGGDVALVLVRGDSADDVERAANEAADGLSKAASVAQVLTGPPAGKDIDPTSAWRWAGPLARERLEHAVSEKGMRERLRETKTLLLAPGASEIAETIAKDPLRLSAIPWERKVELAAGAKALPGGVFVTTDGKARLVVVEPKGRAFDPGEAARFTDEAEGVLDGVRKKHAGVTLDLAGGHVLARQTESMMRTDLQKSSVLSIVLASIVFVVTFRRPRALVALLPPLAAGTLWTTAIAAIAYPKLSAIATAFAAVVVGVGVDTGVHVYGRLLGARREGLSPSAAADVARRDTWKPTLGAACAAGGAFACLAIADIEGMRQLGILCAVGEVLTAVAILIVVPEIGAWLEKTDPPRAVRLPWIAKLTSTRPRALVALAVAVLCVIVALDQGAPRVDHGVVALDAKTVPAMAVYDAVYETFGGTRGQLLVVATDTDRERARARADAVAEAAELLAEHGTIEGFDALGQVAPSTAAQKARLAARDRLNLPARRALLEKALADEGFSVEAFSAALDAFEHPSTEITDVLASTDSSADWIKRRHVATDEQGTLVVTFVRTKHDPGKDETARTLIRAADPEAVLTGFADLEKGLEATLARDLPRILLAAGGMVLVVLAFALRSLTRVILAVVVLAVEIAIVLVLARVFGVRWHIYDALVLPVLLGITLDEAMFLLEAASRRSIEDALAEQAPLGATTALTTAAGFGALIACRFGGLVDLGKVGALGSIVGLACALVVIPAGMRVLGSRS